MAFLRIDTNFDNTVTEYSDSPITGLTGSEISGSTSFIFPPQQQPFIWRWNGVDIEDNSTFNQEQYLSSLLQLTNERFFQIISTTGRTNVNTVQATPIEFDTITDPSNAISVDVPTDTGFTVQYRGFYQVNSNISIATDDDLIHTIGFQVDKNGAPVFDNVYASTVVDRNSSSSIAIAPVDIGLLEIGDVISLSGFAINGDITPEVRIVLNGATFRLIRIGD